MAPTISESSWAPSVREPSSPISVSHGLSGWSTKQPTNSNRNPDLAIQALSNSIPQLPFDIPGMPKIPTMKEIAGAAAGFAFNPFKTGFQNWQPKAPQPPLWQETPHFPIWQKTTEINPIWHEPISNPPIWQEPSPNQAVSHHPGGWKSVSGAHMMGVAGPHGTVKMNEEEGSVVAIDSGSKLSNLVQADNKGGDLNPGNQPYGLGYRPIQNDNLKARLSRKGFPATTPTTWTNGNRFPNLDDVSEKISAQLSSFTSTDQKELKFKISRYLALLLDLVFTGIITKLKGEDGKVINGKTPFIKYCNPK